MQLSVIGQKKTWIEQVREIFTPKEYDFKNPHPYAPPRFDVDDPNLVSYFQANGYVVVKEVANQEQRETAKTLFWDLVEFHRNDIKRDDPSTWEENWVADNPVGIMTGCGIGQSAFMWHSRTLPKVKQAFEKIWGTDDLLVSFDGCGVFRPPEHNKKWATYGAWYHIDQNCYKREGLHAVLGIVNYLPSGPNDGGFVVVPKSNAMIAEAFKKNEHICSKNGRDYVRVYPEFYFWEEARKAIKRNASNRYDLLPVKIVLQAGDMVLWDSRCIHCSHPASPAKQTSTLPLQLKRLIAYVCMTPTTLAENIEELVKYRTYAFQKGISTNQWPHEFYPNSYSNAKTPGVGAAHVKLTPEQATLITGKTIKWDVYNESLVEDVDLEDLRKNLPTED